MPEQYPAPPPSRWRFWRDAFWRPLGAVVMIPYAMLGLALLVRDEIIQPKDAARWKIPHLVSLVPIWVWVTIAFVFTLAVMFEGAYRVALKRDHEIALLRRRLAPWLQLLPNHKAARFTRVTADENETPIDEWHRVVIQNVGIDQIDDVRAFLHELNGHELPSAPIELHAMHDNDLAGERVITRLLHDTPVAFDLIHYNFADDTFSVCGRAYSPGFKMFDEITARVSIAAPGRPTHWETVSIRRGPGPHDSLIAAYPRLAASRVS